MKLIFIMPSVGKKDGKPYVKTWQMEPLSIAVLSALTPERIEKYFFDDRMEDIDYEQPADLVAISVETYTARRAYQIAAEYKKRNIPVVMGGFHPTLAPGDAKEHADSIVIGEAEGIWPELLNDFKDGKMKRVYQREKRPSLDGYFPDRTIYSDKKYQPIALVETARGCRFQCEFCSVTKFFNRSHIQRPVSDVIKEISEIKQKYFFFTDDNIASDKKRFRELLKKLIPLKIFWSAQTSIDIYKDTELLKLMRKSGCICILIGFETLNPDILSLMEKPVNGQCEIYNSAALAFSKYGIGVYGTFVFGYDNDNIESFKETYDFALKHGFFFTAFNHLVPFPGTPLYNRLENEGRLLFSKWWLSENYRFGDVAFKTNGMNNRELSEMCYTFRHKFYNPLSIIRRMTNWRANCCSLRRLFLFLTLNILSRNDVAGRQQLPLGK